MHAQLVAGDHLDQALLLLRSLPAGGSGASSLTKSQPLHQQRHDDPRRTRMAAVMMRAIGVKSSSSSSLSSNGAAEGVAGSSTTATGEQWDGQSLSRQTSRLSPPNPALVPGRKLGILINALRPPSSETVCTLNASAGSASTSSSSDGAAALAPAPLNPSLASSAGGAELRPSVSLPASAMHDSQDRGRSTSRDAAKTVTRPSPAARGKSDVTGTSNTSGSGPKIRFAPLPEIRQRSYSTGRNIWLAGGGSDPGDSSKRDIVIRRDGDTGPLHDSALYDDDDDYSDDDDEKPAKTMFGSWKTDLTFGVIPSSSSSASRSSQGDESSYSKLLRPLSFGMVGKKKRSKRPSSIDGRSSSLSRTSSNDSDVSRGTSAGSFEGRGTGIPMRKTATWESGDSIGASPAREPRRANYPPVAQRSRNRASQALPLSISAPEFNEWGTAGSVGSFTSKLSTSAADDDDGGGMAWIKKRRAQREAEAKRKAEEEEAERRRLEQQEAEEAMNGLEDEGVDEPDLADTMELDDGGEDDETMSVETPTASTPRKALQLGNITNHIAASQRRDVSSSAMSSATTPRASEAPKMENGAVAQIVEIAPASVERSESPEPLATTNAQPTPLSPTAVKMAALSLQNSDSEDEDDEEEGDSQRGDDDTDSDLDEDELAKEEALVEQARVTAKSAGAERYHSASHQSAVLTPHTRSGIISGHVSSVPGSRIPTPNRQSTLTQADAGNLPIVVGDGGHRVATPSRQGTITQANFDELVQQ